MSFGDREDDVWGAMKPTFRPRVFGDPNMGYAAQMRNGSGRFARSITPSGSRHSDDAKATLARIVRKSPEVMVKVTGRKKGAKHLGAHLQYIGRHGKLAIETRDGEQIETKADMDRVADEWSDPLYWRQGTTVSAVAMVFSMPEGTNPETVKQAVRETAELMLGDNHDWLMALHTDTPRPHVHLTVQAEGMDRKRFDPRREDLFHFREAFAAALRSRGIEAEATPRYTRGQGKAGASMALTQMRAKILSGASKVPTEADVKQAREAMQVALGKAQQPAFVSKSRARWADTRRRFEIAAEQLDQTGNRADRELARDVRAFLQERPTIETVPDRVLRKTEQRLKAGREREAQQPQRAVTAPEKEQRRPQRQHEPQPPKRTPPTRRR